MDELLRKIKYYLKYIDPQIDSDALEIIQIAQFNEKGDLQIEHAANLLKQNKKFWKEFYDINPID